MPVMLGPSGRPLVTPSGKIAVSPECCCEEGSGSGSSPTTCPTDCTDCLLQCATLHFDDTTVPWSEMDGAASLIESFCDWTGNFVVSAPDIFGAWIVSVFCDELQGGWVVGVSGSVTYHSITFTFIMKSAGLGFDPCPPEGTFPIVRVPPNSGPDTGTVTLSNAPC